MKIGVLLSGGVDSTYSAYLLQSMGHEVKGFYLKMHANDESHQKNLDKIETISEKLGIVVEVLDLSLEFEAEVYEYFITSYKNGTTPNPCARCNAMLKFGKAHEIIKAQGYEKLASGHYARIEDNKIKEAIDKTKDQSYFLFGLKPSVIQDLIFPLGGMMKEDIKAMAFKALPWLGSIKEYKESQDICFVEREYTDVLKKHFEVDNKGDIKDLEGNVIGRHKGYMNYTIGKRKGLEIDAASTPHYVIAIDADKNEIIAADKEKLATLQIVASNAQLPKDFIDGFYSIKARYNSSKTRAYVKKRGDILDIELEYPIYAAASGQAAVIYKKDVVVGGGWIR